MGSRWMRTGMVYGLIVLAVVVSFTMFFGGSASPQRIPVSEVIELAKSGAIQKIVVNNNDLTITTNAQVTFRSKKEAGANIYEMLSAAGVNIENANFDVEVQARSGLGAIFGGLIGFLPLIFFGAILLFMMRQAQGSNNQTMNFGRSRARMIMADRPDVTFADVAGVEEAKGELQEIVEFLKYPERFLAMGARIPKGILLVGPPGTGKTLMSRAVAGEAGVPFFSISGSEFVEMFVGVGASRVRDLFGQAKRNAPAIIFVDEIDAVGRHRGAGLGGGHDEREQTLNQILVEMDGFDTSTNVIIIAATNRPDILDPALLRPGRFDRRVVLDQPDIKGRMAILNVHIKGKPLDHTVNLEDVAKAAAGFSGADLSNLVNEAAILATRRGKKAIGAPEFAEAVDRVVAGPERKGRVVSSLEREITAYHEAGHALVAFTLPNADEVHKISIVARGNMGGYTRLVPEEDRHMYSKAQFEDMLATALGGRVAEELTFRQTTTGASNDLEVATKIARQMVTRYGMTSPPDAEELPISSLMKQIVEGDIQSIEVYGNDILAETKAGILLRSRKETEFSMVKFLEENKSSSASNGVRVTVKPAKAIEGLGPRTFGRREETVFLGREISEQRDYGNTVADEIDAEVHTIIVQAYDAAKEVLVRLRPKLAQIAKHLVVNETVEGKDLKKLFESEAPPLGDTASPAPAT